MNNNIIDVFNEYFEIVPAISDELKEAAYKLRYKVYCVENSYLDFRDYPDQLEIDEYDSHSSHYLIRHRRQGIYMATTRLILPVANDIERPFQIELHSDIKKSDLMKDIPRQNLGELSRFCVSKQFRQRQNEQHLLSTYDIDSKTPFSPQEKRSSSHLTLALIACAIKMSADNDIHYWYALIEPALKRLITALGVHFVGIGPTVDYHGLRQPGIIKISDLLEGVAKKDINYWNMLTNLATLEKNHPNLHSLQKKN